MDMRALANKANTRRPNHSILLYGHAKTGKTRLVGTAAKLPEIKRIFWFDGENGAETLLHMGLTEEELGKITLFQIPDTRENPRFIETVLKAMTSKTQITICDAHGKVDCVACATAKEPTTPFLLSSLTKEDLVVIDSGSQLGDSAMSLAMAGTSITTKAVHDHYMAQGKYLGDILSIIQSGLYTNYIVITHAIAIEEEMNGVVKDKYYPLMGTRNFSQKVAKYFGTVIFVEIKMGKHAAGSSSLYKHEAITGSRMNVKIENAKDLSMHAILSEGKIL